LLKKIGKYYFQKKGYYPVTINDKSFKGDPFHIGFWRIVKKGGFEPEYFKILDQYLSKDSVYCDIGSWIGPTVMYASDLCKRVFAFEPDKIAYPYLLQNIELNDLQNVTTFNIAIGKTDGIIKMGSHGGKLGDSMTSMVNIETNPETIEVPVKKWDTWLRENNNPQIDFIKIDIEGGEFELVKDMINYLEKEKPILNVSLHPLYLKEEDRKKSIRKLFKLLDCYNSCYDANLNLISLDKLKVDMHVNGFYSYLFMD